MNSALQRARATLETARRARRGAARPGRRELLARYVDAFEAYDIDALTALIQEDATQSMPPFDLWLRGRDDILTWWFGPGIGCQGSRVVPTVAANGSPAFGQYKPAESGAATSRGRCRCSRSQAGGSPSSRSSSTPRRCSRSSGCRSTSTPSASASPANAASSRSSVETRGAAAARGRRAVRRAGARARASSVARSGASPSTSQTIGDAFSSDKGRGCAGRTHRYRCDEFRGACPSTGSRRRRPTERIRPMTMDGRTRWYALIVLCAATLMIVLDSDDRDRRAALDPERSRLLARTSLAWVVNAYLLTFGGFLLLGGRLGDLYGHRRLFIGGIALFTVASLACGLAQSQHVLEAARAVQGVGGAVASAVSLSITMMLFTEQGERAKAMGIFGFVASGGGSIGVLLGGVLTDALDWHWIFLVNLPIGIAVVFFSLRLLPAVHVRNQDQGLDIARCGHGHPRADDRRLRDRERQRGRLADRRARSGCSRSRRRSSALFLVHRVARLLAAHAAAPPEACATWRRRTPSGSSGPARCSRGSSSRRSTSSSCSATARSRSGSRSCRRTS